MSFRACGANVQIFRDLTSANLGYKRLAKLGGAQTIGLILMGMSVHVLHGESEVEEIVNMAPIAAQGSPASGAGRQAEVTVPRLETLES